MVRAVSFLLLLMFFLQVHVSPAAEKVSFQEILSNPGKYDGQEVTIHGKASKIKPRTSKHGNDYTMLILRDESGKTLKIFSWGHPLLAEGQKVTVTGIYKTVKRIGRHTFHNGIQARNIIR
jgi:hypothetical protein